MNFKQLADWFLVTKLILGLFLDSPFMDIDAQQLYDYYSRQLILDDRTNDTSSRAKIPFAINFIAAGASIRK